MRPINDSPAPAASSFYSTAEPVAPLLSEVILKDNLYDDQVTINILKISYPTLSLGELDLGSPGLLASSVFFS